MTNLHGARWDARLFLLASLMVGAQASALDLKGLELGKPATAAQLKAFGVSCPNRADCHGFTQLEGLAVKASIYFDRAGRVDTIRIAFDSGYYDRLHAAAITKYGAPASSDVTPMQNGFGARVNAQSAVWNVDGGRVWIIQYLGSVTEGQLKLESAARVSAERAKDQADSAKSKM